MLTNVIEQRCHELGLTLEQAQRLAVESDRNDPKSLYRLLDLQFDTLKPGKPKKWLWMAVNTSNVSYRSQLSEEELQMMFLSGQVPSERITNVLHLLDESPPVIIVMAAHDVAVTNHRPAREIMANIVRIATQMNCKRWNAFNTVTLLNGESNE